MEVNPEHNNQIKTLIYFKFDKLNLNVTSVERAIGFLCYSMPPDIF